MHLGIIIAQSLTKQPTRSIEVTQVLIPFDVETVRDLTIGEIMDRVSRSSSAFINGWTPDTLRKHYRASSKGMKRFLVLIAESGTTGITGEEAAPKLGYKHGWHSVMGMSGAAANRARRSFPDVTDVPWSREWSVPGKVGAVLTMPPDMASVVLDEASRGQLAIGAPSASTMPGSS
jgi:hypothetical protein